MGVYNIYISSLQRLPTINALLHTTSLKLLVRSIIVSSEIRPNNKGSRAAVFSQELTETSAQ